MENENEDNNCVLPLGHDFFGKEGAGRFGENILASGIQNFRDSA